MFKRILKELILIRRELQSIRKSLETRKENYWSLSDLSKEEKWFKENYTPLHKSTSEERSDSNDRKKKEFEELKKRVENIESGETVINTLEYGKKSIKWYVRMICGKIKSDSKKELESLRN